jgi:hypothetical protein
MNVLYPKLVGKRLQGAMGLILVVPWWELPKIVCDYVDPCGGSELG